MNLAVAAVTLLLVAVATLYTLLHLLSHTPRPPMPEELQYESTSGTGKLGSITDAATVELSLVVPCYNETKRILVMLTEAVEHLRKRYSDSQWEVVIVDDGSRDGSPEYVLEVARNMKISEGQIRVIRLSKNRGKGGAVRHGVLHSRGKLILFADADGASRFADLDKLEKEIQTPRGVAIGSRAHMVNTDAVVKRSFIRNVLMYGLHTLVYVFGIHEVRDTQCGFKMFTRDAAREIFTRVHTEGWIFDVEVLILAQRLGIKVAEVPISWHEVDGSKVDLARDSVLMAKDLVVTRLAYILGIYKS